MSCQNETKKCLECNLNKNLSEFYKTKKGHFSYCKTCHSKLGEEKTNSMRYLVKKYGISIIDLNNLLINQNRQCKICSKEILFKTKFIQNRACIDHEENTLNIRGLLCHNCNTGLGQFKHNINNLSSAINYLNSAIVHIGDKNLFSQVKRKKKRINTTGYLGVTFDRTHGKYLAKLTILGKTINIGRYFYPEEAAIAYDTYVKENIPNYQLIIELNNIPSDWNSSKGSELLGNYFQINNIKY